MMKVYLIGCGLGNPQTLTVAAQQAIAEAQLLVGASRLVEPYRGGAVPVLELISAADIERALRQSSVDVAAVLLSGDVGFYSGATGLYDRLADMELDVIPGISSLVYFCAKLHTPWQDAFLVSAHGRSHNGVGEIQCHAKTFLLTGGATKVVDLCAELVARGLGQVRVAVGERLSYPDERITQGTAEELMGQAFDSLAVMLVWNDRPIARPFQAPALADEDFQRGDAPMTKESIRKLIVCKLQITRDALVWDVGAGTGSVSCEMALAACAGQVFAVEYKQDALALIEQNRQALGLSNITVVAGKAPEVLADLPAPTHVFVGGSSGNLRQIIACALEKNPQVKILVSAITLETVSEMLTCAKELPLEEVDLCQVQASVSRSVGSYHLMTGQNPVYLMAAQGACRD